jgi:hypothetical protein
MVFVFFSESQFESYRMLGVLTMEILCTDCDGNFRCFVRQILTSHLRMEPAEWLAALIRMSPTGRDAIGRASRKKV